MNHFASLNFWKCYYALPANIRELAEREPDPEYIASFNDQLKRAFERLRDSARDVALLRLDGHTN